MKIPSRFFAVSVLPIFALTCPAFAQSDDKDEDAPPPPKHVKLVGVLSPSCAMLAIAPSCTFTPANSRRYRVQIVSETCEDTETKITGVPKIVVQKVQRLKGSEGCVIAIGYASFKGEQTYELTAASKGWRGRAIAISFLIIRG